MEATTKTYKANSTEGWRVSLPFRVLTSKSTMDIECDEAYDYEHEALYNEQNEILDKLGYDLCKEYSIRFGRRKDREIDITIDDAIQLLALKDGADLVEFIDGHIGFIGYYYGFNENYFEIIGEAKGEEE